VFYLFELSVLVMIRLGSWRHIQEESRRPLSLSLNLRNNFY